MLSVVLFFGLSIIATVNSQMTPLPEAWKKAITCNIQKFQDATVNGPPSPMEPDADHADPMAVFCPYILLWSPLEQFRTLIIEELECPVCASAGVHGQSLSPSRWQHGASERTQPRKIHDLNGIVLLVSRVYKCSYGHEILGHDSSIINSIPSWLIPFLLWHKTGVTKAMVDDISILVDAGVPITSIESILMKRRRMDYTRRLTIFKALTGQSQAPLSFDAWSEYFPAISPGWHTISTCFRVDFSNKKEWFIKHMQQMTVSSDEGWLSCDHTFASAGNIGLSRSFDHRWITQYNSLFCVTNEEGQVMTWKLTKSVAFSDVEDILVKLKERLTIQKKAVHEFYVDICCSWRPKLQKVFGDGLTVYLDLFHAVKRVSSTVSKRHPLHYECIRALSMVFRDPTDHGKIRHKPTPSPSVMLEQIKLFQQQWNGRAIDGKCVLSAATHDEISRLCKHIEKGCLSGIKPGRGTNRNEALHKSLNSHIRASRYGIELAFMLLTTSFYQHNEKIEAQKKGRSCKLLMEHSNWLQEMPLQNELFGIITDYEITVSTADQGPSPALKTLYFDKCSYHDLLLRFTETLQSVPELDLRDAGYEEQGDGETGEQQVYIKDVTAILLRAVSWFTVYNTLSKYTSTATLQPTEIPLLKANFGYSLTCMDTTDINTHVKQLSDVLQSWNFRKIEVPGDGNCLFTSVALYLQSMKTLALPLQTILANLGIDMAKDTVECIADMLRRAVVSEWLGHSQEYTAFLTSVQLEQEAQRFLRSGEFSGELGDLVIAALSNVLHLPIVVFTSIPNLPLLVITPSHETMDNPQPIHLTFTQHGPGHYDMAVYHDHNSSPTAVECKCTCGRKKQQSGTVPVCITILNKYSSRCPCYNSNRACTEFCKCKNCQNPFGFVEKVKHTSGGVKRKRRHQEVQQFPMRGTKTMKYLDESNIPYSVGSPTTFERLVVLSILDHLITEAGPEESDTVYGQIELILFIFNIIKSLLITLCVEIPLYQRSLDEIRKIVNSYALKLKK